MRIHLKRHRHVGVAQLGLRDLQGRSLFVEQGAVRMPERVPGDRLQPRTFCTPRASRAFEGCRTRVVFPVGLRARDHPLPEAPPPHWQVIQESSASVGAIEERLSKTHTAPRRFFRRHSVICSCHQATRARNEGPIRLPTVDALTSFPRKLKRASLRLCPFRRSGRTPPRPSDRSALGQMACRRHCRL